MEQDPRGRCNVREQSIAPSRGLVRVLSPGLRETATHSSTLASGAALAGGGVQKSSTDCCWRERHRNRQEDAPCPEQRSRLLGCLGALLL